jgi:hypothetical protein
MLKTYISGRREYLFLIIKRLLSSRYFHRDEQVPTTLCTSCMIFLRVTNVRKYSLRSEITVKNIAQTFSDSYFWSEGVDCNSFFVGILRYNLRYENILQVKKFRQNFETCASGATGHLVVIKRNEMYSLRPIIF